MPETRYVETNGIRVAYETFGDPAGPPALLITGLSVQMLAWPDDLCEQLVAQGFYVVRADNRDAGLSTHLDSARRPTLYDLLRRRCGYTIEDMAADVAGLIEALALGPVHLVGVSMGGFITQTVAVDRPDLVASLTQIMTSTGNRRVGRTKPRVAWRLVRRPVATGRESAIAATLEVGRLIGSPGYPLEEGLIRDIAGRSYDRIYEPYGRRRQLAAVRAQRDRTRQLARLSMPALVVHGLADPVIAPDGGLALAASIPGAQFLGFSGMGHDLPSSLWPRVVAEIAALAGLDAAPAPVGT